MKSSVPKFSSIAKRWVRNILLVLVTTSFAAVFSAPQCYGQQTFQLSVSNRISASSEGFEFRRVEVSTTDGLPAAKDLTVWCYLDAANGLGEKFMVLRPIPITLTSGQSFTERELYLPQGEWNAGLIFSLSGTTRLGRKDLLRPPIHASFRQCDDILVIGNAVALKSKGKQIGFRQTKPQPGNLGSTVTAPGKSTVDFNRQGIVKSTTYSSPDSEVVHYDAAGGITVAVSTRHRPFAELPKRWLGYSSVEQVVINGDDLQNLARDAERLEALTHWVAMGGTLVVGDCGDDFRHVANALRGLTDAGSARLSKLDFHVPTTKLKNDRKQRLSKQPKRSRQPPAQLPFIGVYPTTGRDFSKDWEKVSPERNVGEDWKFDTTSDVLLHRIGAGEVLFHAVAYEDLSKTQRLDIYSLCVTLKKSLLSNMMGTENSIGAAYGQWQLINVGIAPMGLFIFVVVAFMTLIGPVGYSYLNIKRKLHYQIWLVPLISAMACATLLGYAFLAEGVGTKLRPVVFVELDQDRKLAATYRRYSVYSALQPTPYQFGDDQFATLENSGDWTPSVYRWSGDGYELTGGYASARNVHQVFVAAPLITNSRVDVRTSKESQSVKVTHRFKDELRLLVVKVDGKLYVAPTPPAGVAQTLTPIADSEFSKHAGVKEAFQGLIPTNSQNYRFVKRRRYTGRAPDNYDKQWDVGVEQMTKFGSAWAIPKQLEDGHYIAIMGAMQEIDSIVPGAREIDGSVIVHGKW